MRLLVDVAPAHPVGACDVVAAGLAGGWARDSPGARATAAAFPRLGHLPPPGTIGQLPRVARILAERVAPHDRAAFPEGFVDFPRHQRGSLPPKLPRLAQEYAS